LTFSIVFQAFASMCVAIGLAPVTGQPMPMLSMGGTSLIFTGLSIGIVLSVSRGEADERAIADSPVT
jgi:cell division protein FtsW